MSRRFDYFTVLAEMRTGSNFLEENLNLVPGVKCWGEAFNPHFVGHAGKSEMAGISQARREADPSALLDAMRQATDGLAGFRFFHDHDPRMLELCLDDPRCAKVVLIRNPLESYVSLKIARQTGQWRLGDMKQAKSARISFDAAEFARHLNAMQQFQLRIQRRLQVTGQTAFYLAYEDVGDLDVINGLAAHLGAASRLAKLSEKTKVQNPAPLRSKVTNYDEMVAALGDIDHFNLGRTPSFEPRRGPNVPAYLTAPELPLIFMPLRGGPTDRVTAWMAQLAEVSEDEIVSGQTQKYFRKWKRQNPGHRSFTVLRHPALRVHEAFCTHILPAHGPDSFADIRETLRSRYGLPIPEGSPGPDYDRAAHREGFLGFLRFVKGNLGGQTSLRTDPSWASQSLLLQDMGQFMQPDLILREEELDEGLRFLAGQIGRDPAPTSKSPARGPFALAEIHDAEIAARIRDVYQRDFMMFGFRDYAGT